MFKVVRGKKIVAVILLVLIALFGSMTLYSADAAGVFLGKTTKKLPIYNVATEEKKLSISFDAAWGADKTEKIMDICDEFGVTATFFLVGFWMDKYPDMVKQIHERGFEIGTHSNTHPHMNTLSKEDIVAELQHSIDKIKNLVNTEVTVFRPPFGEYNDRLINTCEELKIYPIQWDVDSLDWKGLSGSQIASRILGKAANGSIILCHNNSDHIVDALPIVLAGLKNKGYTFVHISELIYKDNYYIDHTGKQHKNI